MLTPSASPHEAQAELNGALLGQIWPCNRGPVLPGSSRLGLMAHNTRLRCPQRFTSTAGLASHLDQVAVSWMMQIHPFRVTGLELASSRLPIRIAAVAVQLPTHPFSPRQVPILGMPPTILGARVLISGWQHPAGAVVVAQDCLPPPSCTPPSFGTPRWLPWRAPEQQKSAAGVGRFLFPHLPTNRRPHASLAG